MRYDALKFLVIFAMNVGLYEAGALLHKQILANMKNLYLIIIKLQRNMLSVDARSENEC